MSKRNKKHEFVDSGYKPNLIVIDDDWHLAEEINANPLKRMSTPIIVGVIGFASGIAFYEFIKWIMS